MSPKISNHLKEHLRLVRRLEEMERQNRALRKENAEKDALLEQYQEADNASRPPPPDTENHHRASNHHMRPPQSPHEAHHNRHLNHAQRDPDAPRITVAVFRRVMAQFVGDRSYPYFDVERGLPPLESPDLNDTHSETIRRIFEMAQRIAEYEGRTQVTDKDVLISINTIPR
ncbi:hypothetical protein HNY73_008162 [Argiope bruennichi]|uniref:Uncharacterized protein n=1 Tax=Argiope bruennichi TaxID=94029 RepID=A0A8T0F5P7_ARGBR|nr:hypothetical protein HNY73_008162 [Argiope bruennichi]